MFGRADDLVVLVALARDQQHVAGPRRGGRQANRRAPVDLRVVAARGPSELGHRQLRRVRAADTVEDHVDDRRRILRARVVRRDDRQVGVARRDLAHDRALAAIAIAAAAEHHDQALVHHRAHRRDGALQPVGRVRVVDHAQHAAIVGDPLQPTRDRDIGGAAHDRVGGQPARDRHADRDGEVLDVVVADERRFDLQPPHRRREGGARAVRAQRAALDDHVRVRAPAPARRRGAPTPPWRARASSARPRRRRTSPRRRASCRSAVRTGSPSRRRTASCRRDNPGGPVSGWSSPPRGRRNPRPAPGPARAKSLLTRRPWPLRRAFRRTAHAASAPRACCSGPAARPPARRGRGTKPSRRRPATGPPRAASPRRYT